VYKRQVQGLLCNGRDKGRMAADVAWVTDEGEPGTLPFHFNWNLPHWLVPKGGVGIGVESPVYRCQFIHPGTVQAFQGSHPEARVGNQWVFNHHGNIHTLECPGYFFHRKRISGGSGTHPQNVDPCL
jgi:hypothetical protein